jgi:hypothetical protein
MYVQAVEVRFVNAPCGAKWGPCPVSEYHLYPCVSQFRACWHFRTRGPSTLLEYLYWLHGVRVSSHRLEVPLSNRDCSRWELSWLSSAFKVDAGTVPWNRQQPLPIHLHFIFHMFFEVAKVSLMKQLKKRYWDERSSRSARFRKRLLSCRIFNPGWLHARFGADEVVREQTFLRVCWVSHANYDSTIAPYASWGVRYPWQAAHYQIHGLYVCPSTWLVI